MPNRPDKQTVLELLQHSGHNINFRTATAKVISDDGDLYTYIPGSEYPGKLAVSPEILGWTWDELNDPNITE
ncbi:hypothetical protein [Rothia halotolerans]|uniref:hypothetical protein n=1 Tax=Rothia halotolerans TaxID=405770 RepID=UPI00101CC9C8|nr:hypothetical protein [Rothia halotolerans]